MNNRWKILQWATIGIIAFLGVLWQFFPVTDASERMDSLPLSGFGFHSQEFEVTEVERAVFRDNNLMKRLVSMGRQQFFLSVVDGTKYRNAVHDPTLCFLGSGYTVDHRTEIRVPGGHGEIIHMVKGDETFEVFVCFSDGSKRYASVLRYWFDTTLRRLTLGLSGEEPVRIIIQPVNDHPLNWRLLLFEFSSLWKI